MSRYLNKQKMKRPKMTWEGARIAGDELELLRGRNQSMNCRKCGGEVFIAAVDRGTNNTNAILHQIGCRACGLMVVGGPTLLEAVVNWDRTQRHLPRVFLGACGGVNGVFKNHEPVS